MKSYSKKARNTIFHVILEKLIHTTMAWSILANNYLANNFPCTSLYEVSSTMSDNPWLKG